MGRCRAYRHAIRKARYDGLTDARIVAVLSQLGANPDIDVLRAALQQATHEQDSEPRTLPGDEALRGSGPDSVAA